MLSTSDAFFPELLAIAGKRNGQAALHSGQGYRIANAFPALNQRADLRDQGREPIGDVMSRLIEGERSEPGRTRLS